MHTINGLSPYKSSVEGISNFPETVTALGVKLDSNNNVTLTAPFGINDVVNLKVRPTPTFKTKERIGVYKKRILKKNWKSIWYKLQLE